MGLDVDPDFIFAMRTTREPGQAPPPRATPAPNLLQHGIFHARHRPLFGLDNAAATYAASIRSIMCKHEDRPGPLLRATMNLETVFPASVDLGFPRVPGHRRYTLRTLREQLNEERRGQFPNPYWAEQNSDSADDEYYDPTHECFHIEGDGADGTIASTEDTREPDALANANAEGNSDTSGREPPPAVPVDNLDAHDA